MWEESNYFTFNIQQRSAPKPILAAALGPEIVLTIKTGARHDIVTALKRLVHIAFFFWLSRWNFAANVQIIYSKNLLLYAVTERMCKTKTIKKRIIPIVFFFLFLKYKDIVKRNASFFKKKRRYVSLYLCKG